MSAQIDAGSVRRVPSGPGGGDGHLMRDREDDRKPPRGCAESSMSGENSVAAEQFSADLGKTAKIVISRTYHE